MVGITAPSFGGKTFSALRLATGMQKVVGGKIYLLDTEKDRSLHYKDNFDFIQVPFEPPYNPESYANGIEYCLNEGAKVLIVDQMTYEHSGEGGVLDMIEEFLESKAEKLKAQGRDYENMEAYKWTAQIKPKRERKSLNNMIRGVGAQMIMIFLFRANDKTKPGGRGEKPVHVGWQAETTSDLPYDMTVRFLLPPGSDGKPNLNPDTEFEKMSIKMPSAFREWFKPDLQLNEELGERLAKWSIEGSAPQASEAPKAETPAPHPAPKPAAKTIAERTKAAIDALEKLGTIQGEKDSRERVLDALGIRDENDAIKSTLEMASNLYMRITKGESFGSLIPELTA